MRRSESEPSCYPILAVVMTIWSLRALVVEPPAGGCRCGMVGCRWQEGRRTTGRGKQSIKPEIICCSAVAVDASNVAPPRGSYPARRRLPAQLLLLMLPGWAGSTWGGRHKPRNKGEQQQRSGVITERQQPGEPAWRSEQEEEEENKTTLLKS